MHGRHNARPRACHATHIHTLPFPPHAPLPTPSPQQRESGNVKLDALPPRLQEQLKAFDVDGDGDVSISEIARAAELYAASRKQVKNLRRVVLLLFVALAVVVGVAFGLTYASAKTAIAEMKDMKCVWSLGAAQAGSRRGRGGA